jgi:hypothetical protein
VRVLAGQARKPFKYTVIRRLGTRGGGLRAPQFGSLYVVALPGMSANGHVVQICLPETRARFLHAALCEPVKPPRYGGHDDMRMSMSGWCSGEQCLSRDRPVRALRASESSFVSRSWRTFVLSFLFRKSLYLKKINYQKVDTRKDTLKIHNEDTPLLSGAAPDPRITLRTGPHGSVQIWTGPHGSVHTDRIICMHG